MVTQYNGISLAKLNVDVSSAAVLSEWHLAAPTSTPTVVEGPQRKVKSLLSVLTLVLFVFFIQLEFVPVCSVRER